MKILFATPNFHQQRGNTVTVQRIVNELEKLGVQTEIISITDDQNMITLPKCDLVHDFNAFHFYQLIKKLDKNPTNYIVTLTGTDLNQHLFNDKTRNDVIQCLKDAKIIHVFNEEAKHLLLNELTEVKDKVAIIPQGADSSANETGNIQKEADTFLYVLPAGIRTVKNVPFALQTLRTLYEEKTFIRLWIVGPILEESEGELVKALVEENKSWVTYTGQVPHKQMGYIYQQADCVLNTSLSEGQPSSILEAMAHGVPVLVSNNHGNRSIVTHLENGLIYKSASQFLDYATQIIYRKELTNSIVQNAKNYITTHHSSQKEAETLLGIYQRVQLNR
jgi:glycosyltransferase involved in cell wall biosynthesis